MADGIGIIGGGALGMGAAFRLAQAGERVTIIEREPAPGGLAAGFQPGADSTAMLDKFYHHLFRTDRTAIHLIKELGLGSALIWDKPVTASLRNGQLFSMSPLGVLRLSLIPPLDRLRFGASVAALKLMPNERLVAGQRAAAWSERWLGRAAYESLIEPLLRGKFGARADDIAMSWLWSRFHERSLSLGYLRGGFQTLYDTLAQRIRSLGGTLSLGTTAQSIRTEADAVRVDTDRGAFKFRQLLVTVPQHLFGRLAPELPADYARRYPGPEFFSAHVLILALDRPLTRQYWISISDPGFPFLVLVEHTNFLPAEDYGGRHLVYLGNYLPPDAPLLRMSESEVVDRFLPYLSRFNPLFERSWVREHWMFHAPFAQPIVTPSYLQTLPPHRTPLPNVYLATMAHVYPQDRGQNYSLALGQRMAAMMLRETAGASPRGDLTTLN